MRRCAGREREIREFREFRDYKEIRDFRERMGHGEERVVWKRSRDDRQFYDALVRVVWCEIRLPTDNGDR